MSLRNRSATPPQRRGSAKAADIAADAPVPSLALAATTDAVQPPLRTPRSSPPQRSRSAHVGERPSSAVAAGDASNTSVRVVCRVRPMSEREKAAGTVPAASSSTDRREVVVARSLGGRQVRTAFNFDGVLGSFSTQEDVFNASVRPLVEQVLSGYDATAFAYGQTGTGKTYTMEGEPEAENGAGLMPRAAAAVIHALADSKYVEHTVTISYLEIYNEELSDLLAPVSQNPQKLELMEGNKGVCCVGLSEVSVQSLADITELVKAAQERRRMAETRMNSRSSRSHCIFTMKVSCKKRVKNGELDTVGKLHLVDLAGSECAKKAAPLDDTSLKHGQAACQAIEQERERRNINQSLLTLGRVIGALRENSLRVPYRDSKLTRLLKDALGGNCKTVLIATISPALASVEETISTLTYAEQASGIQNKPVATSFLRMTTREGARGDFSGSSLNGCNTDWAEVEMKIMYLTQEVEEAQAALARKYQEMQEVVERAENAEQEADLAKMHVSQMQEVLGASAAAHTRSAASSRSLVVELQAAAAASAIAREEEARQLAELRGQRFVEEQVLSLLQQQRQELHDDVVGVQKELEGAKTELVSTKSEMKEIQAAQEQRFGDAMQAILKFTSSELTKVGQGFTEGVERSCERVDGVCGRLDATSNSASAAAARSAGAGQKAVEAVGTWCKELSAKHNACHQSADTARQALEVATTSAADQLGGSATLSETAATTVTQAHSGVAIYDESQETTMKENEGPVAGKLILEKKASSDNIVAQAPLRAVLKEVN